MSVAFENANAEDQTMSLILGVSTLTPAGSTKNFLTVRGIVGAIVTGFLLGEDGTDILNEDGTFLVY